MKTEKVQPENLTLTQQNYMETIAELTISHGLAHTTTIATELDVKKPSGGTHEHEGQTVYFCCPACRKMFVDDPAAYTSH